MKRTMCLWLPNWAIQRVRNEIRDRRPLVLFAPRGEAGRLLGTTGLRGTFTVTACSSVPTRGGVRPGMPLGEAESLLAGMPIRFRRHDADADRAALRRLAIACQRYTPIIALEDANAPECLLLDIAGSSHLFGGESRLVETVQAHFRDLGFSARIAIAGGVAAAWALAHSPLSPPGRGAGGEGLSHASDMNPTERPLKTQPSRGMTPHPQPLSPEERGEQDIIPDLAVELLRLPAATIRLLHQFDLRRIRQIMDLPRADVAIRFGQETLTRLDQILGVIPEILIPERHVEPVSASWQFEDPVAHPHVIENVLEQLIRQIVETLTPRQVGIQRLVCSLAAADRTRIDFTLGLLHPTLSVPRLLDLLRLRLESIRLTAAVTAIKTRALVAPLEARQPRLFESDDTPQRQASFRDFVERLSNRLGDTAVVRPRLKPEEQPEYAWEYLPWLRDGEFPACRKQIGKLEACRHGQIASPIDLLPTPLAVHVETADDGPRRLAWRQRTYDIVRSWGPQRIETGWWRERDIRRDYYRVETSLGDRFWLFRDRTRDAWFLHGVFG